MKSAAIFLAMLFWLSPFSTLARTNVDVSELAQSLAKSLGQSRAWLMLGHYKHHPWGWVSEADGEGFFLHPNGRKDPEGELASTLQAMAAPIQPSEGENAACRFPARRQWLVETLPPDITASWPRPECPRLRQFLESSSPRSVTLVFSAYYLNNPSSAFGHTLIRMNKSPYGADGRFELLDYGINYAAVADQSNPVAFAWNGMFGGFRGEFTNVPYYYKVQEYNDYESRDLWEYDLDLTEAEVLKLAAHFWELGHTFFYYYYLTENCSYHMLTALEAAAPRLELTDKIPFWVIPADTVKALTANPGLVKSIRYRPSKRTQFEARLALLEREDQYRLSKITQGASPEAELEGLSSDRKKQTLDAAIDWVDYHQYRPLVDGDAGVQKRKQELLLARSRLGTASALVIAAPEHEAPHLGRGSARAGVAYSHRNTNRRSLLLSQRFALRDLLESPVGYTRDAEIEFFHVTAAIDAFKSDGQPGGPVRLETFYPFQLKTMAPFKPFLPNVSWKIRLGAERVYDPTCDECLSGVFGGGAGLTFALDAKERWLTSLLAASDLMYSESFAPSNFRAALGPQVLVRWLPHFDFSVEAFATYQRYVLVSGTEDMRYGAEMRWSPHRLWSLQLLGWQGRTNREIRTGLFYYY